MGKTFRTTAADFKRALDDDVKGSTKRLRVHQLAYDVVKWKVEYSDGLSRANYNSMPFDQWFSDKARLENWLFGPDIESVGIELQSVLQSAFGSSWQVMATTMGELDKQSQQYVKVFERTVKDLGISETDLPKPITDGILANSELFEVISRQWNPNTLPTASSAHGLPTMQQDHVHAGPSTATAGAGSSGSSLGHQQAPPRSPGIMDITRVLLP
ncbi:hypothetical protein CAUPRSCDRAFT_11542 [Caulochytrium protostelioides]|uniref:Uncharacterized protein n=1 Tax=Caulochytrium protostelioides TaxID=1555241 RepID=A0A4P9WU55_9FUNG|nr:hypothetical protein CAUPRSCDRAFT_11542 [Caulochytrium protostelioides]